MRSKKLCLLLLCRHICVFGSLRFVGMGPVVTTPPAIGYSLLHPCCQRCWAPLPRAFGRLQVTEVVIGLKYKCCFRYNGKCN